MTKATSYTQYCFKHDLNHPDSPTCPMCKQDAVIYGMSLDYGELLAKINSLLLAGTRLAKRVKALGYSPSDAKALEGWEMATGSKK
jgi:hypothetical protein